jgi:hypothetical protein
VTRYDGFEEFSLERTLFSRVRLSVKQASLSIKDLIPLMPETLQVLTNLYGLRLIHILLLQHQPAVPECPGVMRRTCDFMAD